jgi:tricorn protease
MRQLLARMFTLAIACFSSHTVVAQSDPALFLQYPTVSKTQIVFNYGGDLWIVSRNGGDARRLTSGVGDETVPSFSPDGTMVAFTGEYDGNRDVFVVPATGGVPKRLTFHPADDYVLGWTPDGKKFCTYPGAIVSVTSNFSSTRYPSRAGFPRPCRSPSARRLRFLPMAITWRTFRIFSGRRPGSAITGAKPRPSGLPT